MKKENKATDLKCPYCKSVMRDGKCGECGAWMDSYGTIHKAKCQGGFHDEEKCPVK
jgi:DNA-directed RNA polymerase subunit RPC12/RpoP